MIGMRVRWAAAKIVLALVFGLVSLAGPVGVKAAYAQVATTTVVDTVYHADGTAASGTVLVNWAAFTTMGGQSIPAGSESIAIGAGGALSVALVPNVGATPIGGYYTVVYHLDDGSVQKEFWVIPVSSASVSVATVRSTVLPTSVAMQTVTKSYVDTAIARVAAGVAPLDASPYVTKTGDTMTGPLVLPGDPVSANQAADKHYVDASLAGFSGGLSGKVVLNPTATQVIAQPAGTDLEVSRLNGVEIANQYAGPTTNGVAGALASSDCVAGAASGVGCVVEVEPGTSEISQYAASQMPGRTHVEDERVGARRDTFVNPGNPFQPGNQVAESISVTSTESTQAINAATGQQEPQSVAFSISHNVLTGGSNLFPENLENPPYFKSNYAATQITGRYYTLGQHSLLEMSQNCYAVGDCLLGSQTITSSGGYRDSADEGAHPYDLHYGEDSQLFQGICSAGCTTGSQVVTVGSQVGGGTQGEGRFLIDKNPAKVISTGVLTGGASPGLHALATFSGTSFPVSTMFSTAAAYLSQIHNLSPGTVTVAIATSGVPAGFSTSTAAAPGASGVACVADQSVGLLENYEMVPYTVVDGSHLQMTLAKPHGAPATIAIGGLCGYGVEQTVDTTSGFRQVFPVIGSPSSASLYYAAAASAVLGRTGQTSAYVNVSLTILSLVRSTNVVTVTFAGGNYPDVNGLTLTIAGVADSSFNGSFVVTSTSSTTLTYAQTGVNSTSSGGTASIVTGGFALYPMAEVVGVYDAATKSVDGQMTLAPNTVAWAANDAVEEPHFYSIKVGGDIEHVAQKLPRPNQTQAAGYSYEDLNGVGLRGFDVANKTAASSYFGNGGTHAPPDAAYSTEGVWNRTFIGQAGEQTAFELFCNSKGCNRWNSVYNLFELQSSAGFDTMSFDPAGSNLQIGVRGSVYGFSPLAFTAGTANVGTINATTINATTVNATSVTGLSGSSIATGTVAAARLPLMGASGATHAAGLAPDPGATTGTTRYLREDGTWMAPVGGMSSFNGRSGAVVAVSGDYSFGQIAGSVAATQMPALSGDVASSAGATVTTLATVNGAPGSYGSASTVPVLTIDGKGRVTSSGSTALVPTSTGIIAGLGYTPGAATPLLTGMLARYDMVPAHISGTTLVDQSGSGNNGTFAASAPVSTAQGLTFAIGTGVQLPAAVNAARTVIVAAYITPLVGAVQPATGTYPGFVTSTLSTGYNFLYGYAKTFSSGAFYGGSSVFAPSSFVNSNFSTSCNLVLSGYHVFAEYLGTNASTDPDHMYVDGQECASYNFHLASAGFQTSGNFYLGVPPSGTFASSGMNGQMYFAEMSATGLTASQIQTETAAINTIVAGRGVVMTPAPLNFGTPQLICGIDSITAGYLAGGVPGSWCSNLTLTNQPAYSIIDVGITGLYLEAATGSAPNREALDCKSAQGPNIYIAFGGTNDLVGFASSPAQAFAELGGLVQTMKQAGCRVGVGTMISRTGNTGYTGAASLDSLKDGYDALILNGWKQIGADFVVDFAADPRLGADGAYANPNTTACGGASCFSVDGIHPLAAGQLALAAEASNALNYYASSDTLPVVVSALPYTMTAGNAAVDVPATITAGGQITLPSCLGQSGARYRINNQQSAFGVTVIGSATTQPINGLTTAVTVPANGSVTVIDVPNPKTVAGCHWEM